MRDKMQTKKTKKKVNWNNEIKRHLADSTALMCTFPLVKTAIETQLLGIEDDKALKTRLISTALVYGGLGSLTKLRDASKEFFGFNDKRKNYITIFHLL